MIKSWFVSQGKNYDEECKGGYILAPIRRKDGAERFFWDNMTKVQPGDLMIFYSIGIRAVGQAADICKDVTIPQEVADKNDWTTECRRINCEYFELERMISISKFREEILKYGRESRSAFNVNANVKQGYLFDLNGTLALIFLRAVVEKMPILGDLPFIEQFLRQDFETELDPNRVIKPKKDKAVGNDTMNNQMLSNLERLMALHDSTHLIKQPKVNLPRLLTKKDFQTEEDVKPKISVTDLADTRLRKLLEEGSVDEDEIYDMRFRDYSETTFGIQAPLLLRAKALTFDDSPMYFRKPVIIGNDKFYLYSKWTEKQRKKLEKWINELDAKVSSLPEYKDIGIRDLAKGVLRDMLMAGKADEEEIEKMLTLDYSSETFDIKYPLLVTERNPSNVANYFKLKVPIRGKVYFLCSQWFEQPKNNDRPFLERWIKSHRD